MGRNCQKGKPCGATCIERVDICRKDLQDGISGQMGKVSSEVNGDKGSTPPLSKLDTSKDFGKKISETDGAYDSKIEKMHQAVNKIFGEKIIDEFWDLDPSGYESDRERKSFDKLRNSLVKDMGTKGLANLLEIIHGFTGTDYTEIRAVQLGSPSSPKEKEKARLLEDFVNRRELPRPPVEKFRGINVDDNTLEGMVKSAERGGKFDGRALSSWSTSLDMAKFFADRAARETLEYDDIPVNRVIFRAINSRGVPIGEVSGSPEEYEVLTPGGAKYRYAEYRAIPYEGETYHVFDVVEK